MFECEVLDEFDVVGGSVWIYPGLWSDREGDQGVELEMSKRIA
jgi:hypothetical protein